VKTFADFDIDLLIFVHAEQQTLAALIENRVHSAQPVDNWARSIGESDGRLILDQALRTSVPSNCDNEAKDSNALGFCIETAVTHTLLGRKAEGCVVWLIFPSAAAIQDQGPGNRC